MQLPIGFVLDGSNLWRLLRGSPLMVLDRIADQLRREHPAFDCLCFGDASLRHQVPPAGQAELARRIAERRLVLGPGGEDGDRHLLALARDARAIVVSRDRFRDHRELRRGIPLLTPRVDGDGGLLLDHVLLHAADRRLLRVDAAGWLASRG